MSHNSSITAQGSVKYNAQRDVVDTHRRKRTKGDEGSIFTNASVSKQDDEFTIMPRELCLRWKRPHTKKRMYTDTDVNVFSSANGLFLSEREAPDAFNEAHTAKAKIEAMRQQLDFGGIAATRAEYSSTDRGDEQMVVLFGGTTTIRNTGHKEIRSGDYVQWDLPVGADNKPLAPKRSTACRHTKLLFQTNPFNPSDCDLSDDEYDKFTSAHTKESVNGLIRRLYYEKRRRVFGRALSSAPPGKEFDVLMGRYMA